MASVLLGASICRQGRDEEALVILESALAGDASLVEGWNWLAVCLRNLGRYIESGEACGRALALKPGDLGATLNLGLCHLGAGDFSEASMNLGLALAASPNNPQILYNLGLAQEGRGDAAQAAKSYRRAIQLAPNVEAPCVALGNLLWNGGDSEGALSTAHEILERWPSSVQAHLLMAKVTTSLGRTEDAKQSLKAGLEAEPENSLALAMLGNQLQFEGQFGEASSSFRRSLAADPGQGLAYWGLVQSGASLGGPEETQRLRELVRDPNIASEALVYFWYALGRAEEGAAESMAAYDEANRLGAKLAFGRGSFDPERFRAKFAAIRSHFERAEVSPVDESSKPIFIVGMIRSGTTLLEQMLSAHPAVAAGGELKFWGDRISPTLDFGAGFMNTSEAARLIPKYLELLEGIGPGKEGVTDKMPDNILLAGLIHALLPNAKVLMLDRNPVDNCLSIYTTPFAFPPEYALNRTNIALACEEYGKLAEHWLAVLPSRFLLQVSYEELVAEPERVMRGVLAHCGLPWDDQCLRPQDNIRTVSTPSVWQVRQSIYTSSAERWRRYEGLIPEFERLLQSRAE